MQQPQQFIDSLKGRYKCSGAVISLEQMLMQRYAARTMEYITQKRSIAGISGNPAYQSFSL